MYGDKGLYCQHISFVYYIYIPNVSISHNKLNSQSASVQIPIDKFQLDYILTFVYLHGDKGLCKSCACSVSMFYIN